MRAGAVQITGLHRAQIIAHDLARIGQGGCGCAGFAPAIVVVGGHFVNHHRHRLGRGGHDKAHRIGQRLAKALFFRAVIACQHM